MISPFIGFNAMQIEIKRIDRETQKITKEYHTVDAYYLLTAISIVWEIPTSLITNAIINHQWLPGVWSKCGDTYQFDDQYCCVIFSVVK